MPAGASLFTWSTSTSRSCACGSSRGRLEAFTMVHRFLFSNCVSKGALHLQEPSSSQPGEKCCQKYWHEFLLQPIAHVWCWVALMTGVFPIASVMLSYMTPWMRVSPYRLSKRKSKHVWLWEPHAAGLTSRCPCKEWVCLTRPYHSRR